MVSPPREPPNWQAIIERALFGQGFRVGADPLDSKAERFWFALRLAGLIGLLIAVVRVLIRFRNTQ